LSHKHTHAVVVSRIVTSFSFNEALQYAKTYRERGYITEVISIEEACRRTGEGMQQDLTKVDPSA